MDYSKCSSGQSLIFTHIGADWDLIGARITTKEVFVSLFEIICLF